MKKTLRLLIAVLAVALLVGILYIPAGAATLKGSGSCGDGLIWNLYDDGTLNIRFTGNGTGEMNSYGMNESAPWNKKDVTIRKVIIAEGCTSIGDYAFYNGNILNGTITSVRLPTTLRTIGICAFYGCSALTELTFPESLTKIGGSAFSYCGIRKAILPEGLETLEHDAFSLSLVTEVTLPGSLKEIPAQAFGLCTRLEKVTLSEGIEKIGADAFDSCQKLAEVTIPESVTEIGKGAFKNCTGLKKIINLAPDATIGDNAFPSGATVVTLIKGDLGGGITWRLLEGVLEINGTGSMPSYEYFKGAPWSEYKSSIKAVRISEGITQIGGYAFLNHANLTEVSLPSTLTTIKTNAFAECSSLAYIEIPAGVSSLQDNVFRACTALESVKLPDGLKHIGNMAFYGAGLTNIVLPDSIETLSQYAFASCAKLETVTFGENLNTLGSNTFLNCKALKSVTFRGDEITSIGASVFKNCVSLTDITLPEGVTAINSSAFQNCQSLTGFTFGDKLTLIDTDAFHGCTALEKITIPESVTTIGNYAFYNTAITSVHIPKGVTSVGNAAFSRNRLDRITVDVENTKYRAAGNCLIDIDKKLLITAAADPTIPADGSVTKIGRFAFYGLEITSVTIPEGITEIDHNAFDSCKNLTEIVLPESLNVIGQRAFKDCTALKTAVIKAMNITIDADSDIEKNTVFPDTTVIYGFAGTDFEVYYRNFNVIYGGYFGETFRWMILPDGTLDIKGSGKLPDWSDSGLAPWYDHRESIKALALDDGITYIGNYSFYNCCCLVSVDLPEGLTGIGSSAFRNCVRLQTVYTGSALRRIGAEAFAYCYALKNFTLPEGLTDLDSGAFGYCTSLTAVKLPASLRYIGSRTFFGCEALTSLTVDAGNPYYFVTNGLLIRRADKTLILAVYGASEIEIPEGITAIGEYAFYGYTTLKKITIPVWVTAIGEDAFANCSALTSVAILSKDATICDSENTFPESARIRGFKDSTALSYAQKYSRYLEIIRSGKCGDDLSWYFLDGTLRIYGTGDMYIFDDSTISTPWMGMWTDDVRRVEIGAGVSSVSEGAFSCLRDIEEIIIEEGNTSLRVIGNCLINTRTKTLIASCRDGAVIPDDGSVTAIGKYAFNYYKGSKELTIPACITSIGEFAFMRCTAIKSVRLDENISFVGDMAFFYSSIERVYVGKPQNVGYAVFSRCESMTDAEIYINPVDSMFHFCTKLTRVTLGSDITKIDNYAFGDCTSLKEIMLPDGITEIGASAFNGCGMTGIVLPSKLVRIGAWAFAESKLTSIVFPESLENIEHNAFRATAITEIHIPAKLTSVAAYTFNKCTGLVKITVDPENKVYFAVGNCLIERESGKLVFGCRGSVIPTDGSVKVIGDGAFMMMGISHIEIPASVTAIEKYAFYEAGIVSIVIPAGVTNIGGYALYGDELKNVVILSRETAFDTSAVSKGVTVYGFDGSSAAENADFDGRFVSLDSVFADKALNVAVGADFTLRFHNYMLPTEYLQGCVKMVVKLRDRVLVLEPQKKSDGSYSFFFENIAPQVAGETVSYSLTLDGNVLFESTTSVKRYLEALLGMSAEQLEYTEEKYAALKALIYSTLDYAAAAQDYTGFRKDDLVNRGYEGLAPSFTEVTGSDRKLTGSAPAGARFIGVGVRFDSVNNVFFRFTAEDISKVTIVLNGKVLTEADFVKTGENTYTVYSESVYATGFDTVYTAVMTYDGVEGQSLSYSVRSFVGSFANRTDGDGKLTKEAKLARAMWVYGNAAKTFAGI